MINLAIDPREKNPGVSPEPANGSNSDDNEPIVIPIVPIGDREHLQEGVMPEEDKQPSEG